jgi:RNA polymerase sigma-70 factor (ECF subfamily)
MTLRLVSPPEERTSDAAPGREPTIAELYTQHVHYVGAIAFGLLGRPGEVEDVIQDVFLLAVRGLRRRDNGQQIKVWLAQVTVQRCSRQLRLRRFWEFVDPTPAPAYEQVAEPSAGPAERHLVAEVYRALDRLPARERVAWTLRHVEGESLEDVAVLCGCSLATAKRRIASAHEKLLHRLEGGTR